MLSEWELWACANEYVQQHGDQAGLRAAQKADNMLKRGDLDGVDTWLSICSRIEQLLAGPSGPLN